MLRGKASRKASDKESHVSWMVVMGIGAVLGLAALVGIGWSLRKLEPPKKWGVLVASLLVVSFLGALDHTVVSTSLSTIAGELGALEHLSWIMVGYTLAAVTDATENTWVYDTAQATASGEWWIGLSDLAVEGTFVWETGEPLSFTNWGASQPDNGAGTEHCVHYGYGGAYVWNDDQCFNLKPYVCESP